MSGIDLSEEMGDYIEVEKDSTLQDEKLVKLLDLSQHDSLHPTSSEMESGLNPNFFFGSNKEKKVETPPEPAKEPVKGDQNIEKTAPGFCGSGCGGSKSTTPKRKSCDDMRPPPPSKKIARSCTPKPKKSRKPRVQRRQRSSRPSMPHPPPPPPMPRRHCGPRRPPAHRRQPKACPPPPSRRWCCAREAPYIPQPPQELQHALPQNRPAAQTRRPRVQRPLALHPHNSQHLCYDDGFEPEFDFHPHFGLQFAPQFDFAPYHFHCGPNFFPPRFGSGFIYEEELD